MIASLAGRVALVTGCTGGIGSQTAQTLAEAGATVIGADLPAISVGWSEGIPKSQYHQLDVTDERAWERVITAIEKEYGQLDVLVHNAGIAIIERMEKLTLEQWRKMMAVNVEGLFLGSKAATQIMAKSGEKLPHGASMIVMSSVSGICGAPLNVGYCASKGAARLFAKATAIEYSALKYKIRVNSLHPGGTMTGMIDRIFGRMVEEGLAESVDTLVAQMAAAHPLGRLGQPIDIAKGVRFLASDESSYMHGSELVLDGGYSAQ